LELKKSVGCSVYGGFHTSIYIYILVGGFNHLEKYESQWEILSHILWKIKNVSNHQPVYIYNLLCPSRTGC
jgi:hypothetical protein